MVTDDDRLVRPIRHRIRRQARRYALKQITKLVPYSDEDKNSIQYNGTSDSPVKINFKGKNNRLIIHGGAEILKLIISFDCDDGYCEIGKGYFKGTIRIGQSCKVTIGDGVTCTSECYISSAEFAEVKIGSDVMIASQVEIRADDAHPIFDVTTKKRINIPRPILIGNHVWIGAFTKILGGTTIGNGSVIGLGSIVKRKIPNNCIATGVPAKVTRKNIAWERPHLTLAKPYFKPDAASIKTGGYWNLTEEDIPAEIQDTPQDQAATSQAIGTF